TIAAISSATGGAIAVIRVSGDNAFETCKAVWKSNELKCRELITHGKMSLGKCEFGNDIPAEHAYAVFFRAPKTYTGEDIAEIYCHGGGLIAERILEALLKSGARQARPGEFTYRAFVNGKMDLSQAEAVAEIISAKTKLALDLAEKQLDGALSEALKPLLRKLEDILSDCEAELDFAEEHQIDSSTEIVEKTRSVAADIQKIMLTANTGILIRNGARIVIAGHPNAGKSSLFNLLLGKERAIVTSLPGTTRDTIEEDVMVGKIRATLIDTAGIRQAENIIENLGIQRSRKSIQSADIILWLLDPSGDHDAQIKEMKAHCSLKNGMAVWNKSDLLSEKESAALPFAGFKGIVISVAKKRAIDKLKNALEESLGIRNAGADIEFAVNARHLNLLYEASNSIKKAEEDLQISQTETASLFIRKTISAIRQIMGEEVAPDVLDSIFSKFCIGK
ncbi:MAG TPA: tRNA uridine-5-carboxymethylaminomethyl(34) synthesis GTPase MnmE, partial [Victivallales bacterium]|nr:tRNA uridine-5-carboxymethylaminomethyl(34) synthesis GTPase MnmE [Victivallales bacterium]